MPPFALIVLGLLAVWLAPLLPRQGDAYGDLESFDGLLRAARAEDYWALNLMEDGEVTWHDLEIAHEAWRDCMDRTGLRLVIAEPRVSPIDGRFDGYWWEFPQAEAPDTPGGLGFDESINGCIEDLDPVYLSAAYDVTHEEFMEPVLRQYVTECLSDVGTGVYPTSINAEQIAADLGIDADSSVMRDCIIEGEEELFPRTLR
ncbi:MAG: hypothetical protein LBG11_03640 [Bifidobacteriaceae bacterium]|nr:hypothetical protein [Bifidobacteriaceae bacterium]